MKAALGILLVVVLLAFAWQLIRTGWRASEITDRDEAQGMLDGFAADFAGLEPPVRGAREDEGGIHACTVARSEG